MNVEQLTSFDEKYFSSHWVFWLHILSILSSLSTVWDVTEISSETLSAVFLRRIIWETDCLHLFCLIAVFLKSHLWCFFPVGVQDLALEQGFVGKRWWGGFICGSYSRWRAAWSIVYAVSVCVCVCVRIGWRNEEEKTITCQCATGDTSVTQTTFTWQSCDLSVFITLVSLTLTV